MYSWTKPILYPSILPPSGTTLCCYVTFPTPHLYLTNVDIITNIRHYVWLQSTWCLPSIVRLRYYLQ